MRATFDNSYTRLPARLYSPQPPVPVAAPDLITVNAPLARELGIDPDSITAEDLSGNVIPKGAEPIAQLYAGHQFGNWVPQLGDGRAVLLGEVIDIHGNRRDIQLKGAGRTAYSRGGDGRAWLGPVLREYVVSEAMHALGIPTTRALAALTTGETVYRETSLPGAILARVAASHIRVGTFQALASRGDTEGLRALTDHALARHAPDAEGALGLLAHTVTAQARLIADWMSVGFIHGVMNTDNMTISGETIDYGPCAFMDAYHGATVFSSIDRMGRYAFQNQPDIALWNLAQLASALVPLIDPDQEAAVTAATEVLDRFAPAFRAAWLARFAAKIGIAAPRAEDEDLIVRLLKAMSASGADFTNTFRALAEGDASAHVTEGWADWAADWQARLAQEPGDPATTMRAANPAVIPRNHRIEQMIEAAVTGDYAPFHALNAVLARPFDDTPDSAAFAAPPKPEEEVQQTFCGT
ncbi:protein adenylyltransferase SelO [Maritimibacter fusiformis]|uniref:Protein nucleotidyltransferase YdiU n=1 Tax=Maritimibacter fusiformis TaxID=2603819 RepID=A0A5D0RQA4_9RHOB|nr:YdiU family protein [Maritimibacter fusiformis]TYB82751.1 YdiU family protein [Maritimibacter fusiformis]